MSNVVDLAEYRRKRRAKKYNGRCANCGRYRIICRFTCIWEEV